MQKRYRDLRQFYDVNSAVIPATRGDEKHWRDRDASITEKAERGDVDLAFIGDSITQGWEGHGKSVWDEYYGDRKAINLGIGGDRTEHVIWRLTHGNLGKIRPKVAVLMIGTNNTGHFDAGSGRSCCRVSDAFWKSCTSGSRTRKWSCTASFRAVLVRWT